MTKYLRFGAVLFLALAIILSCTVVGNKLTDPATYSRTIEALDENRSTVLALTAASAAASAAISALPDDIGSPLSEEIADVTSWFMVILGFVYLEKYLLTILGSAACYILFPVGFGALLIHCFFPNGFLKGLGTKFIAFALVMVLAVPAGVRVSDMINNIYAESIAVTVESAEAVGNNLTGAAEADEESGTVIDEASSVLSQGTSPSGRIIGKFKNVLNRFIEATAIMIVSSCLIPVLVVLFFVWVAKTLFNIPMAMPTQLLKPHKHRHNHGHSGRLQYGGAMQDDDSDEEIE